MTKLNLIFLFFIFTVIACGKTTSPASGTKPAPPVGSTVQSQSADGSITLTQTNADPSVLQNAKAEYQRANLVQLPIDAKYNATVLRITDDTISDYANKVFIAPKLFAYGTQNGGEVLPIHNANGTVTLAFNVAFLDGSSPRVSDPSASGTSIDVPALFKVQYPDELKSVLSKTYGADNGLAPLPGCPKRLTVIAAGVEYDATPANLARGDFCELNVPVTVSMTVTEAQAKLIMEVELYAHLVDIEGIYETKVSFPTSKVSISFDRSKIYQDLQAELGVKAYYVDADVKIATTKVMENQLMKVTVQGETSEFVNQLIDKVTAEFFQPWMANPQSSVNPCGPTTPVCLRFSDSSQNQSSALTFDWDESSNLMSGQNYITSTKLKATPNISMMGDPDSNCKSTPDHTCDLPLSNHADARETGLTVVDGNQIMIEPNYLKISHPVQEVSGPTRIDHTVCLSSHQDCHPYLGPNENFGMNCNQVCDQSQDQWSETTIYSAPIQVETIADPVGQMDELFDGLQFRFQWMDQASGKLKSIDCPVSIFSREGNGRNLVVRVQNLPTCSPFTNVAGETPMLYLINRITTKETYLLGVFAVNWDGSMTQSPTHQSITPEISFAGSISISGYSFESESSTGFPVAVTSNK